MTPAQAGLVTGELWAITGLMLVLIIAVTLGTVLTCRWLVLIHDELRAARNSTRKDT